MKKCFSITAGIVLGLLFVLASVAFFLKLGPKPDFPQGSPIAMFFGAFGDTGYMAFVKVFELLGGIFVAIPRTRRLGLLLLGPVIVNILAFQTFVGNRKDLLNPMLILIVALALYLLWVERKPFAKLLLDPPNQ
jgi:putative oxidoreductase